MDHLVIPDCQVQPNTPTKHLKACGNYIAEHRPEVIVQIGDFADMKSLCSYDRGTKGFDSRLYKDDIEASKDAMATLMEPIYKLQARQKKAHKPIYRPKKVLTLGNHECVREDTEILTSNGWVVASEITEDSPVASFSLETGEITYNKPIKVSRHEDVELLSFNSNISDEVVSINHKMIVDGKRTAIREGDEIKQTSLFNKAFRKQKRVDLTLKEIQLLTWVITDGTIVRANDVKKRIQFKLSKERKITSLKTLLEELKIPFTFREATKSGINKLQPYYITIYGEEARKIDKMLSYKKEIPDEWENLDYIQIVTFLRTVEETDGSKSYSSISWPSTNKKDLEIIQKALLFNSIKSKITFKEKRSGFSNGKPQYVLTIFPNGLSNKFSGKVSKAGRGNVIAITTKDETLITRLNGKIAFTGNSRIEKALNTEFARLDGIIGIDNLEFKKFGWEVVPFLQYKVINGITYVHYVINDFSGTPKASMKAAVEKVLGSVTCGHKQTLDIHVQPNPKTKGMVYGIQCGAYYMHDEDYKGAQGNLHWRGIVHKRNVVNGDFSPSFINLETMLKEYL